MPTTLLSTITSFSNVYNKLYKKWHNLVLVYSTNWEEKKPRQVLIFGQTSFKRIYRGDKTSQPIPFLPDSPLAHQKWIGPSWPAKKKKNGSGVITRPVTDRDVKKIRTRGYPWIKPATGKKRILKMDTRYPRVRVFLIPAC